MGERTHVTVASRAALASAGPGAPPWAALDAIKSAHTHNNPKREAMRRMGIPGWWGEPAIERTWRDERCVLSVPRGGVGRVVTALREAGATCVVEDRRVEGSPDLRGRIPHHRVELWPHQAEALAACLAQEQGIVRAGTGSGKTCIGFALAAAANLPTIVIVNVRELFEQWVKRAGEELGLKPRQVGAIQGSRRDVRPLTIAMQQSLHKQGVGDLAAEFGTLIFDEVQLASASSYYEVVDQFQSRYRIGISADNRRKDQKEYLNEDLFGGPIYDVSRDALEDAGKVLDVEVRVLPTEFEAHWYGMPGDGEERELDFVRLNDEMGADDARTAQAADVVAQVAGAGRLAFVMARQREHCLRVGAALAARGVRSGYLIGGEDYRVEFKKTMGAMRAGSLRVGVGTVQAIGTGIDFPAVGDAVVVTPLAGNRQLFGQVRGRVCRVAPGKKGARLWYLWDRRCSFGPAHLKNLIAWNRTVAVWDGGDWVPGREYLGRVKAGAA